MYLQVTISAENKEQADAILNSLLEKELVTGGQLINAQARFLWKGNIINMDYYTIWAFTMEKHKQAIIDDVKKTSVEEVPMVWFTTIDGNIELLNWIKQTVE